MQTCVPYSIFVVTVAHLPTDSIVSIIVSDVVPLRSRGTWQGVLNIIWACGNATGASLGGFLADTIGWRWCVVDYHLPISF